MFSRHLGDFQDRADAPIRAHALHTRYDEIARPLQIRATLAILVLSLISGCAPVITSGGSAGGPDPRAAHTRADPDRSTPPSLRIPGGHYPPVGACRVWYPDRPPGLQPPPQPCTAIERPVPEGTWLIRRSPGTSHQVTVSFFHQERPGTVVAVGFYQVPSGERVTSGR